MFRNSILMENTMWEPSVMKLADPKRADVDRYIEFDLASGSPVRRSMRESIFIIENLLDDALRCLSYFAELPKEERETPEIRQRQKNYRDVCVWIGEWRWKCVAAIQAIRFDPLHYSHDNFLKLRKRWDAAYFKATGTHMPENWIVIAGNNDQLLTDEELTQFTNGTKQYEDLVELLQKVVKLYQVERLNKPINEGN